MIGIVQVGPQISPENQTITGLFLFLHSDIALGNGGSLAGFYIHNFSIIEGIHLSSTFGSSTK